MTDENGFPLLFVEEGTEKICKVGLTDGRAFLLFPRHRRRGEERLERETFLFWEDFEYKVFLLRKQLMALSGYR